MTRPVVCRLLVLAQKHKSINHTFIVTMAAAAAAVKNYFENTLLIDEAPRNALVAEGLDNFDEFGLLTDEDIIKICDNCKSPGGGMANPAYNAQNNATAPQQIKNYGVHIGYAIVLRLRKLRYYCYALHRVGRSFSAASATLVNLNKWWDRYIHEKGYKANPDMPPKLDKNEQVQKSIEDMIAYLKEKYGGHKASLLYVIREKDTVPAIADDQGFGVPTIDGELERRLPLTGSIFEADNVMVWNMIYSVTHGGPAWPWVKQYNRTSNGRKAFLAIKQHFMGDAYQNTIKLKADKTLETLFYNGSRNFSHDAYCEKMKNAIQELEEAGDKLSVERQIRYYIRGLHDPRLSSVVLTIQANSDLTKSLETCMNFVSQQLISIESYATGPGRRGVASLYAGGGRGRGRGDREYRRNEPYGRPPRGRGRGRFGPGGRGPRGRGRGRGGRHGHYSPNNNNNNNGPDRYYTTEEWENMDVEQRRAVYNAREQRQQSAVGRWVWQAPEQQQQQQEQQDQSQPSQTNEQMSQITDNSAMSRRPRSS